MGNTRHSRPCLNSDAAEHYLDGSKILGMIELEAAGALLDSSDPSVTVLSTVQQKQPQIKTTAEAIAYIKAKQARLLAALKRQCAMTDEEYDAHHDARDGADVDKLLAALGLPPLAANDE